LPINALVAEESPSIKGYEVEAYLLICYNSKSEICGAGKISDVLGPSKAAASFADYLFMISIAFGRFFCLSFFILFSSKAFFFLSSSSLRFISIY
jgi:hypothetical protein